MSTILPALNVTAQEVPQWRAQRELRIGREDSGEDAFTRVNTVLAGIDGRIYVSQPTEQTIRVFDASGRFVRRIGRQGGGPGEFEGLTAIGFRGDTLYATDIRSRTVSLFSANGEYITQFRPQVPSALPYLGSPPHTLLADGTAFMQPAVAVRALAEREVTRAPIVHIDRGGQPLDTVLWLPYAPMGRSLTLAGRPFAAPEPLPDGLLAAFSERGVVAADRGIANDSREAFFRVLWIDPRGDTTAQRRIRYTPRSVSQADGETAIAGVVERYRATAERLGATPAELERVVRSSVTLPRFHPPVTDVRISTNGEVWLRREESGPAVQWLVLDRNGNPIGTVALPRALRVTSIAGDLLYGWETNELDVPFVLRYRVQRR